MSRRRGKHLERDRHVAQLVEQRDTRGPCPGDCNAAYRRLKARWEREVLREVEAMPADDRSPMDRMIAAQIVVRARWEEQGLGAWPARPGAPVWCGRCRALIRRALEQLPQMLLLTLETGWSTPKRPDGSPVTAPVRVLSTSDPDEDWRVTERLACGHRHTVQRRTLGPLRPPGSTFRVCRTCVASAMQPEPGRLAPPERAGRSGQRQLVSPAGSPAWVEADAAVEWVCSTADLARFLLGRVPVMVVDELPMERWPWRSPSERARLHAAVTDARFLLAHLDRLLELEGPFPVSVGEGAVGITSRLEQVSGMSIKEHAVEGECPRCDRRGLSRASGSSFVHCRACGGYWDEDGFEREQQAAAERKAVRRPA